MKNATTSLFAITALALSVAAFLISIDWSPQEIDQTTAGERIEELEREIAHLKGKVYSAKVEDNGELVESADQPEIVNLNMPEQVDLNDTVEAMRWTMTVRGIMRPTGEHLAKANEMIFDENTSPKQKLVALRILNGSNKRTDEVARKMLELYYSTSDFNIQAEVFKQLDNMDTPELGTAALEASSSSPSARVREEAIDALSGFLPNPELLIWLEQVSASDKDRDVRREASRLLKKYDSFKTK